MSLKKMIVSGAAALALMGTAVSAAPQPVVVEQDGTGDYLIAPVYYAIANWSTELKVVNTNTTRAVAAKVVVRDSKSCDELVDFVIYLTPGDVWTGTLYEENGKVYLKSTDDSMIIGGQVASPSNPIVVGGKSLTETYTGKDPATVQDKTVIKNVYWHGYVEIFGLANYSPKAIEQWYHDNVDNQYPVRATDDACDPLDKLVMYKTIKNGDNLRDLGAGNTTDVSNDDLMGKETIYAEAADVNGRRTMMLNMMAFGNMSNQAQLGSAGNPIYGTQTSLLSVVDNIGKVASLDAALAKDDIYVMYEGDGSALYPIRAHFTVPTKKYWFSDGASMPAAYTLTNIINTPANTTIDLPFEYHYDINTDTTPVVARDNKEHCNKCGGGTEVSGTTPQDCTIKIHEEVHFFEDAKRTSLYDSSDPIAKLAFAEGGWLEFNLSGISYDGKMNENNNDNNVSFKGMPIIPTTFYAKDVQGIYLNNWLYNQYHKATVTTTPNF